MANQVFPLTNSDVPAMLFVATQSGPIRQRADANGAPLARGLVVINSPGAGLALTLAAPIAGPQVQGGHDGCEIKIVVVAGAPLTAPVTHTITTPANAISGVFSTITFEGDVTGVGGSISLVAYNGIWWKTISSAALS